MAHHGLILSLALAWLFAATHPAWATKDKHAEDGWVPLFNGRDLSGWKKHPGDKSVWEVVDGVLVGSGSTGHLFSERGDYTNFHFRIEARISDQGNSGQYFRATFAAGFPPGYEAQINANSSDPVRTGSLYPDQLASNAERKATIVRDRLVKPDQWFTQEVVVEGNRIVIKVNGRVTVDFIDERRRHATGHFAIQQHHQGSVIGIRRAEVKELP